MAKTTSEKDLPESGLPAIVDKAPGTSRKKAVVPAPNPMPVVIAAVAEPVPVVIEPNKAPERTVKKGEGTTLAPTTTEADDKVTEGQRHINVLWESSQSAISLAITLAVIYCQINNINSETLNNAFFFVVATYLQRTNHVRTGGVGAKADEVYRGR